MTANVEMLDRTILNQIELLRKNPSRQASIVAYLENLQKEIVRVLGSAGVGEGEFKRQSTSKTRLDALLKEVNELIRLNMADARSQTRAMLQQVAQEEAAKTSAALSATLGFEVAVPTIGMAQLDAMMSDMLIEGAPSSTWWARQDAVLRNRFADQMRKGIAMGDTTDMLVQRIQGLKGKGPHPGIAGLADMNMRNLFALVRTSVQSVANAAHLQVYEENDEFVKGVMWVSTLDTRTTPICKALDGKKWSLDYTPIGHSMPFPGPTAHWGCRSTQVPILKSWEELTKEAGGDVSLARKLDKMPEGNRASMTGPVPATEDYDTWLRRQSESIQVEALGKRKFDLWQSGKIKNMEELLFA